MVSRCLGFDRCRYNGQTIPDVFVEKLKSFVDFQTVCPEVEIGLGAPRDPVRVVRENDRLILYQPATGRVLTREMEGFCRSFLQGLGEVDGFLLKNRSPSCGINDVKVYTSREATGVSRGQGFFGGLVVELFPDAVVEDEGRLKNFTIREHFLTALFMTARFRETAGSGAMRDLVAFHANNKLLLMGYSQSKLNELGRIVANHEHLPVEDVYRRYGAVLPRALRKPPSFGRMINVLQHALGGFSKVLTPEERKYFLNLLEEYRDERVPLSVPLRVIEAWAVGRDNTYLLEQSLLHPYPRELTEITDSGKGRSR